MIYDYEGELDQNQQMCGFGFAKCVQNAFGHLKGDEDSFELTGTFLNGYEHGLSK